MADSLRRRSRAGRLQRWAYRSAKNALEIARFGSLTHAEAAAYEVVARDEIHLLRHYLRDPAATTGPATGPRLLVPPLMVTAEIYDVAPELSAVRLLTRHNVDVWVVDFGAPEHEVGGMSRTLDDHIRAVVAAVQRVRQETGREVHLGGYSQGGMFAYQAAAYLRSEGLRSLITFGSPVDIHRNVPTVAGDIAGRVLRGVRPLLEIPLEHIEGVPGFLSSTGFKLLAPHRELEQMVDFLRKLHDRQALKRRESRRRFLGGEGFVAWSGPAMRQFFEELVIHNRMVSGGMVIDGRTLTLADISCPVLCFLGSRDDFARPGAVRAISRAAPAAEVHEILLGAGHFGLVIGTQSLAKTWPSVVAWLRWREGAGPLPELLRPPPLPAHAHSHSEEPADLDTDFEVDFQLADELSETLRAGWKRLGNAFRDVADTADSLRWQLPRLTRLERLSDKTRISAGRALGQQARAIGNETFFLWRGRAFTYADADERVTNVVRGLIACEVKPGDRVAVLMRSRPSYLSLVTALNRLGAVAILLSPALPAEQLAQALLQLEARFLAVDPERAAAAQAVFQSVVLVLGGARTRRDAAPGDEAHAQLPPGVIDMEAIDPDAVELPGWYRPDPGRAGDLAMILVSAGRDGRPKIARITNGRWAFSALGVASACTLSPRDTVYCCLPIHHPTGILVAIGGALMGGARLALSEGFEPRRFWSEVRRYGVTVAFYAGEMARLLLNEPPSPADRKHPLRLLAGSGMRADVWRRVRERFGRLGVLEFYASTERNLVLANASGEKVGALGRRLPGSAPLALVRYDFSTGRLVEREGKLVRCLTDAPGVVIAQLPSSYGIGHLADESGGAIRHDVFEPGDRWFISSDVLRRDADGDYWFVDRLPNMVRTARGVVATPRIEDVLYQVPGVDLAVVCGAKSPAGDGTQVVVASLRVGPAFDPARLAAHVTAELSLHERPKQLRLVEEIPLTEGFRPIKSALCRQAGQPGGEGAERWRYDEQAERYVRQAAGPAEDC